MIILSFGLVRRSFIPPEALTRDAYEALDNDGTFLSLLDLPSFMRGSQGTRGSHHLAPFNPHHPSLEHHGQCMIGHYLADNVRQPPPMSGNEAGRLVNRGPPRSIFPEPSNDFSHPSPPGPPQLPTLNLGTGYSAGSGSSSGLNQSHLRRYVTQQHPISSNNYGGSQIPFTLGHGTYSVFNHTLPIRNPSLNNEHHSPSGPALHVTSSSTTRDPVAAHVQQYSSGWVLNPHAPEFKPSPPSLYQQHTEQHSGPPVSSPTVYSIQSTSYSATKPSFLQRLPEFGQVPKARPLPNVINQPPPFSSGPPIGLNIPQKPMLHHSTSMVTQSPREAPHYQPETVSNPSMNVLSMLGGGGESERTAVRQETSVGHTSLAAPSLAPVDPDWVVEGTSKLPSALRELFMAIAQSNWRIDGRLEPHFGDPIAEKMRIRFSLSVTASLSGKSIYTSFVEGERSDLICKICRNDITSSHALEHIRKHFHHRPFRCTFDDCTVCRDDQRQAFFEYSRLKQHISRSPPITCDACGEFLRTESLKRHKENYCRAIHADPGTSSI